MSTHKHPFSWLIEWSPSAVVATSTVSNASVRANSLSDLKGQVQGKALLVLSRRSTFLKATRLPDAKAADLLAIVQMHAAQLFPQVQGELAYGYKLTPDLNSEGRLAVLTAVPVTLLLQLHEEADDAGIQIEGALAAGLGAGLLASELGVQNATVVEEGLDGFSIDVVAFGTTVYSRIAGSEDTSLEIERSVAASGFEASQIVGSKSSRIGELKSNSTIARSLATHVLELSTLLLELPNIVAKREKAAIASRARFSLIMLAAAAALGFFVWDQRDQMQTAVNKQNVQASKHIQSWTKERDRTVTQKASAAAVFEDIRRAFQPAQPMSDVFTAISNDVPNGVWLTGVSLERGKPLSLRGMAMSHEALGVYLQSLNANERFRDSKLAFANQTLIESTSVVQFSISSHVVGNFPTVKTKQERSKK
jgi:Tfp pilus assembly protein PilN